MWTMANSSLSSEVSEVGSMAVKTSEAARYPDSMAPAKEIFIVFLFFVKWAHEIDK